MLVVGKGAQRVALNIGKAGVERPLEDAAMERACKELRKDGDDIETHGLYSGYYRREDSASAEVEILRYDNRMIPASEILQRYDNWTLEWHQATSADHTGAALDSFFEDVLESLHAANFELWHVEDEARAPCAGDAAIAAAKRRIDRVNQRRNDQVEHCDSLLLQELATLQLPRTDAELHSETPGMMLDRLSILTLKRYHTLEEIERPDAPVGHAERNRERLGILERQRKDLAQCLDDLWAAMLQGKRRFTIYRQLKMYNDPTLNPVLYGTQGK